jgi:transcription initiation factor TFIIB
MTEQTFKTLDERGRTDREQARIRSERPRAGQTKDESVEETVDEGTCPECGGHLEADEAHGDTACTECGLVVEADEVDRGPEWRAFDASEKNEKSRVGAPTTNLMHDKGLSSVIDWQDKDAYGGQLSSRKRQQMQRLRTWDERFRAQSAKDRNLKQALGEIERMSSALDLPDTVAETAGVIYRRALEEDLLPGRSIEAVATASVYAAARQSDVPRSLDEFEPVSRVDRREFARAYRYVARELELAMEPTNPDDFLPRFCSELGASEELKRRATDLLSAGKRAHVHSGKSPSGLAAAAIYAASRLLDQEFTQEEVADVADVSAVTIRSRYRELLRAADDRNLATAD